MGRNIVAEGFLVNIKKGDIVELPQLGFCHYAFYVGDGIIVHVTKKGTYESAVAAEMFLDIVERSIPRVNNFEEKAKQLGLTIRPWYSALAIATNGLEKDNTGKVKIGSYVKLKYNLLTNNCEMFATYCKYDYPGGWTEQGMNIWKGVVGAASTITTQVAGNIPNILNDGNVYVPVKVVVAAYTPIYVAADVATDTLSNVFTPITSTLQNLMRDGGTMSEERESKTTAYSSPVSVGASAHTSRESHEAHWNVFAAGIAGPSAGAEAHAGFDGINAEAKAELVRGEISAGPCKVGVGLQADTGICIKKGKVGASVLGFGAEVGSDGIKVKTPLADATCSVM